MLAGCGGGAVPATKAQPVETPVQPAAAEPASDKKIAPDFTLVDTDGNSVALHDLLKRGPVLLAFFPKAFTGG
jgi:hypothetical protein